MYVTAYIKQLSSVSTFVALIQIRKMRSAATVALLGVLAIIGVAIIVQMLLVQS